MLPTTQRRITTFWNPASFDSGTQKAPLPPSPPPSPPPSSTSTASTVDEGEVVPDTPNRPNAADEVDGGLSSLFFDSIKSAVLHLLNHVICTYRKDYCNGCITNHPSQRQHECLEPIEDGFYQSRFYNLKRRLCTSKFIPAIQRLLTMRNIRVDDARVRTAAETLLHELKSRDQITKVIDEMYNGTIGEDGVKLAQLQRVTECWEDNSLL